MKISEVENILQNVQNWKTCLIECSCDEFYAITSIGIELFGMHKGQYVIKFYSRDNYDHISPAIETEKYFNENELRIFLLDFNLDFDLESISYR